MKPKLYKLPKTKIPWADYVWNISTGCTKVSSGCKFCYAETNACRFWKGRPFGDVQFHLERLNFASLKTEGNIIFVNSMSDLFHEKITYDEINNVINVMFRNEKQWFVVLTKRPKRAKAFFDWYNKLYKVPSNLILGVSVEDNIVAPERLDLLLKTEVKYRCVSIEPYIPWKENTKKISQASEVILTRYINSGFGKKGALGKLDWVIVGAESGPHKRYCDQHFIKNIVASCLVAGTPVFVKQIHTKKDARGKFKVINNPSQFPGRLQFQQYMHEITHDKYIINLTNVEWYPTGIPTFAITPMLLANSIVPHVTGKYTPGIKGTKNKSKRRSTLIIDDRQEIEAASTPEQKEKLMKYYRDNNIVNIGGQK